MTSPPDWEEPAQAPAFADTVVLHGLLRVEHDGGFVDVRAGESSSRSGSAGPLLDAARAGVHRGCLLRPPETVNRD